MKKDLEQEYTYKLLTKDEEFLKKEQAHLKMSKDKELKLSELTSQMDEMS